MKKLVLLLAVVFSASLFSCGNKAENAAATDSVSNDSVQTVETVATDSTNSVTDSTNVVTDSTEVVK